MGLAPEKAVKQLGKILPRMFEYLLKAPAATPLLFSKIKLSDGFWRMKVPEDQKWNFSYVMPDKEGERTRTFVPSDLHMEWCQSPALCCTATEASKEVMTRARETNQKFGSSQMQHFMEPEEPSKYTKFPTELLQVFVDDLILATQPESPEDLKELSQTALAAIYSVFPPPKESGHVNGRDPVSEKKMNKGDGQWSHIKVIIGFLFDGRGCSIQLTQKI